MADYKKVESEGIVKSVTKCVGKAFLAGYLTGLSLETLSGKRTRYSTFLGMKCALVGLVVSAGAKAVKMVKNGRRKMSR